MSGSIYLNKWTTDSNVRRFCPAEEVDRVLKVIHDGGEVEIRGGVVVVRERSSDDGPAS